MTGVPRTQATFAIVAEMADGLAAAGRRGLRRLQRRPIGAAAAAGFLVLAGWVAVNGAFLQTARHPAPFLAAGEATAPSGEAATVALAREDDDGGAGDPVAAMLSGGAAAAPGAVAGEPEATPSAAPGEASGLVAGIQEKLAGAGLYPGPVDGALGVATVQAIEAFQRSRGLPVTGEPSMDLLVALATGVPPERPSVETVARVQSALNARGFGPIAVDGLMGSQTGGAIRRFERSRGLPETGEVSEALMEALGIAPGA